MHNFFIAPEAISDNQAVLTGDEARHLRAVLRLTAGQEIGLFDGTGKTYRARIREVGKGRTTCQIIAEQVDQPTGPALHLGQALLTGQKMDLLIQKATELGIRTIHPFHAQRCTMRQEADKKTGRWQRIALEACKQCNRPTPPQIRPVVDLPGLLARETDLQLKLIFWEGETERTIDDLLNLPNQSAPPESVIFLIGPEGGFTEQEVTAAVAAGYRPISLGRLTLRAETASLAAMAILQHRLGNLHPQPNHEAPKP